MSVATIASGSEVTKPMGSASGNEEGGLLALEMASVDSDADLLKAPEDRLSARRARPKAA